ncbi:MAG: inorganic diphosphatase [Eubacterium sp.]|nr:inorganic diphosphatase [Eubacterium sp.]
MRLTSSPLKMIREGTKTIELRLLDEKRKGISVGDTIVFVNTEDENDILCVMVDDLYRFDSFEELYKNLPLLECGYTEDDIDSASPKDMELYYPKEEQEQYGVVGIKVSLIVGKSVKGIIDRPAGSHHPRHPEMIYPINYGFVEGVMAPDGAEQDVYVLGTDEPIKTFEGKVIAVYHRFDDVEDKWIVSIDGRNYTDEEILKMIDFQEQYFKGRVLR